MFLASGFYQVGILNFQELVCLLSIHFVWAGLRTIAILFDLRTPNPRRKAITIGFRLNLI